MGGSTIFQTIWTGYNNAAQAALTSTVGAMIPVVAAAMAGILSLAVLIAGKNLMFGELRLGDAVTRGVRALVVSALLVAGTFNTYVTTFFTQTLPQQLAGAATGSATASGAAAFDTMVDTLTKIGVQAQAQMIGLQYLGYQVAEWLIEAMAKVFVAMAFLVWMLTSLEVMFFLPAIVASAASVAVRSHARLGRARHRFHPRTDPDGHAHTHSGPGLHHQEKTLMNQFAANVASPPGSVELQYRTCGASSFAALLGGAGVTSPITGQPLGGGASLNAAGAVETMISMLITLVAGFLVLGTTSVVALLVVASGGFSAGNIVSAVSNHHGEGRQPRLTRVGRNPGVAKP